MNNSHRQKILIVFTALSALTLLATGWFVYAHHKGYVSARKKLFRQGGKIEPIAVLKQKIEDCEAQLRAIKNSTKPLNDEFVVLQKRIAPLPLGTIGKSRLAVFNCAAECELEVNELQPLNKEKDNRRELEYGYYSSKNSSSRTGKDIAFLRDIPKELVIKRPLYNLNCRGTFMQIRKFITALDKLELTATPIYFEILSSTGSWKNVTDGEAPVLTLKLTLLL